jgi:rRNA maturation protein Rpf1
MNYITTSRKPSINTRLFAKDLAGILSAEYLTRGKSSMSDLVNVARYNGVKKVFI